MIEIKKIIRGVNKTSYVFLQLFGEKLCTYTEIKQIQIISTFFLKFRLLGNYLRK